MTDDCVVRWAFGMKDAARQEGLLSGQNRIGGSGVIGQAIRPRDLRCHQPRNSFLSCR